MCGFQTRELHLIGDVDKHSTNVIVEKSFRLATHCWTIPPSVDKSAEEFMN